MVVYKGRSACGGMAIGKIKVLVKDEMKIFREKISDTGLQTERFESARALAIMQIDKLYQKALYQVGETNAAIFEIHKMMLEDEDYIDSVHNIINNQRVNAEYAVSVTSDNFSDMFSSMNDAYMRERATDVKDISSRIVRILSGDKDEDSKDEEEVIILAEDLTPSETVQLDKERLLAFVTTKGSTNSHTAILARTMNIPAIVSTDIKDLKEYNGKMGAVDGSRGLIYIEPDKETLEILSKRKENDEKQKELLAELKGKDDVTLDGQKIMLYANIGNIKDLAYVVKNDAAGIGLFRSEFIYMGRETYPTEEEQFLIYKKVAETMAGKKVIIRTLDIGADKQVKYFNFKKEENPAMGLRAIRICLKNPDVFKTQLRAIYRASVYGNISIMYPMITSVEEIKKIKEIVKEVKKELKGNGVPFADIEEGIMIETPAAVMISDLLSEETDFFSIGTNDLSQYTMAIDRQNEELYEFFNPYHLSVLRMIELVCKNAREKNIWVGICGELGADTELTEKFLKMGVKELSVSPSSVLSVRKKIRSIKL